jgi:hypothetical protein
MKNNIDEDIDDIVNSIIKLPIKNLEERIKNIKIDIKERETIFESSLSILARREIEIEFHLSKMKYSMGNELNRKFSLENELANIRNTKIGNTISHFHDSLRLKEKLQLAKEQLTMERKKRKLID